MPYVAPEVVQRVKQIDLLTYLKNYEPYELVHFSGNVYTTRSHDSLKISNGKWMWWSRGIGGRSALDYLIKVRGYDFVQAVQMIAEQAEIQPPVSIPAEKKTEKKLILPKPYRYQTYAVSYLQNRGIDMEIIRFCLKTHRLYESENYHNVVFVGMDESGTPRYAALRGISSDFLGEASGSDKNYSFCIPAEENKSPAFRHIQILIHEGSWAIVSKEKTPAIHFVIRHPKMREAMENITMPIVEGEEYK